MEGTPIVLDNGSGTIKVGFAGECEPRVVHDNVFTALRVSRHVPHEGAAKALQSNHARFHVVDHGIVTQWEGLLEVIEAAMDELKVQPQNHPFLLTEAPLNPTVHRELLAEHLFEELQVPALQVAHSGSLALYATNSRTGLVIEVGDGVAQTVPLYDSYMIFNAVKRRDFGGRDLTAYLGELLRTEVGYKPDNSKGDVDWRTLTAVKESMCRVRQRDTTNHEDTNPAASGTYQLPDGKVLHREQDCLAQCAEALFQPARLLKRDEEEGIQKMATDSILACSRDILKDLAGNIVLSGGSMLFPGMCRRVEQELQALLPSTIKAAVSRVASPAYAAFTGGSIVASMPDLQKTFMTKAEYEEYGAAFIHTRSVSLTKPQL
mmetsp:Transcript_107354/g.256436  ORF Transcript_107354/g.256436 Transcript_107354/m.256436 type:complete len:377 (-) Transcript_107354:101-1231(-)